MTLIQNMERLELLECVNQFGFAKGAEVYWIHRFKNLPENQYKSRRNLEFQIVDILRIPKCSKSTFDKTFAKYSKLLPKLMSRDIQSKLELFDQQTEKRNEV